MKRLLLSIAAAVASSLCFSSLAYTWNSADAKEWMKHIPGDTYVAQLSIPGTHDTFTYDMSAAYALWSQTQTKNITEQMEMGIRAFDIRPATKGDYMQMCHGIHATNITFDNGMASLINYLKAHPSEFFVVHVLHASGSDSSSGTSWDELYRNWITANKAYLVDFRRDLTVDDCRGKMILLNRDQYVTDANGDLTNDVLTGGLFIYWKEEHAMGNDQYIIGQSASGPMYKSKFYSQDIAETSSDELLAKKKTHIANLLDFTTVYRPQNGEAQVWTLNFLSAYAGTTSTRSNYCANAAATAPVILDYLASNSGPTGIVMMDFAGVASYDSKAPRGDEVVAAILANNFKYITGVENGVGTSYSTDNYLSTTELANSYSTWAPNPASKGFLKIKMGVGIMADFDGNNMMDIYYGGDGIDYTSLGWNCHTDLYLNNGTDSWTDMAPEKNGDWATNNPNGIYPLAYPHYMAIDYNCDGMPDLLAMGVTDFNDALGGASNLNCATATGCTRGKPAFDI